MCFDTSIFHFPFNYYLFYFVFTKQTLYKYLAHDLRDRFDAKANDKRTWETVVMLFS